MEYAAAAQVAELREGPKDGLAPCWSTALRHDWRNDIDELGQARSLDPVGVVEQRDAHAAEHQRVLDVVDLLQDRRRLRPSRHGAVLQAPARAVPDVPLVEAQPDALGGAAA